MSNHDMTVEKKLAALQQIRSTYNQNQYDLTKRERILYGKTAYHEEGNSNPMGNHTEEPREISFLGVRVFLAIALLIAFVWVDQNSQTIAGLTAEQIYEAISYDYTEQLKGR